MKKSLILFVIVSLFLTIVPFNVRADEDFVDITKGARNAILMDFDSGDILYNKNATSNVAIASLTKMMGLILIFEAIEQGGLKKNEVLVTSKTAKEMGGTQIWLEEGEKISVNDLIKGIVMASANELVVTIKQSHL